MSFIDFVFQALNFENYSDLFNIASILVCSTGFLANVVSNCIAIPIIPIVSCALKKEKKDHLLFFVRIDFHENNLKSQNIHILQLYLLHRNHIGCRLNTVVYASHQADQEPNRTIQLSYLLIPTSMLRDYVSRAWSIKNFKD